MELDIQYIQDSNLKVDLRIIFQTVGVVFTGQENKAVRYKIVQLAHTGSKTVALLLLWKQP